jgi:hypothetical protein
MATAFLYKWTHIPTQKWYIGSRTAKGCSLTDGYICSSKIVKPMILENKNDWKREILVIGSSEYILQIERKYLILLDARNDTNSFNLNNCTPVVKLGPRLNSIGEKNHFYGKHHTEESKQKIKYKRSIQVLSTDRNLKISNTLTGHTVTRATRSRISNSIKQLAKIQCNYCLQQFLPAHYGRFHGNKCKKAIYE